MGLKRFWVRIQKNLTGKRPLGSRVKCPRDGHFKTRWSWMCHLLANWSSWGMFVKKSRLNACFLIFTSFQNNYYTSTILLPWNRIRIRKSFKAWFDSPFIYQFSEKWVGSFKFSEGHQWYFFSSLSFPVSVSTQVFYHYKLALIRSFLERILYREKWD